MAQILANIFYLLGIIAITLTLIIFICAFFRGWFKTIQFLHKGSKILIAFMDKVLPSILEGMEKKKIIESGTLKKWTEIIASDYALARSPKDLSEAGNRLLEESGVRKIVDDHLNQFIENLEKLNLKSAYDVEQKSFYILKGLEKSNISIPLKNFLYQNPTFLGKPVSFNDIFFVGGLYLRDKYLEKHPELLTK